jgi:hypothetical protein
MTEAAGLAPAYAFGAGLSRRLLGGGATIFCIAMAEGNLAKAFSINERSGEKK